MGDVKGGGGAEKSARNLIRAQSSWAHELFGDTRGIRSGLFDRSEDFLGGGMDVRETPAYEALKLSADSGFNQAKDNLIARFAPGGGLIDAVTDLEAQRANTLTQGAGQIYDQEIARAIALGTGVTGQSLGALGNATQAQMGIAQSQAQQNAAGKGALGSAAGMYLGGEAFGNKK